MYRSHRLIGWMQIGITFVLMGLAIAYPDVSFAQATCDDGHLCGDYCCPTGKSCDDELTAASCGSDLDCGTYCCGILEACEDPAIICREEREYAFCHSEFVGIDSTIDWQPNVDVPSLTNIELYESSLNSLKSTIHMTIDAAGNGDGVLYCIWDDFSSKYLEKVDGRWQVALSACTDPDPLDNCCTWALHSEYGAEDGFFAHADDGVELKLRVAARNFGSLITSPGIYPVVSEDRTAPLHPLVTNITTASGTPDYLQVDWSESFDREEVGGNTCDVVGDCPAGFNTACTRFERDYFCTNAIGNTCEADTDCPSAYDECRQVAGRKYCRHYVDYVLLRGKGGANGDASVPAPSSLAPPKDYRPINGEWDSFDDDYTDGGVMQLAVPSPLDGWPVADGVLTGNCPNASCRISFNFNGSEYDFSNGYIMTGDIIKVSSASQHGGEIIFGFKDHFARWAISEADSIDPSKHFSKIYYSTNAADPHQDLAYNMGTGKWHQFMIYVRGNIARGFLDGVKMWELNVTGISGDPIADLGGNEGFRIVNENSGSGQENSIQVDNFMIAPFLVDTGVPALSWNDTVAVDEAGPLTHNFTNTHATSPQTTRIDLTVYPPEASATGPNYVTLHDRSTSYHYYVMAIDKASNVSNLLVNPGFEAVDISDWQQGSGDGLARNISVWFEGGDDGSSAVVPTSATVGPNGVQVITNTIPSGSTLRFSRWYRFQSSISGQLYPAVIESISPALAAERGQAYPFADAQWHFATTFFPSVGTTGSDITNLEVYAEQSAGSIMEFNLDANRLDVIAADTVTPNGTDKLVVEYLTLENGNSCLDSEFSLLGEFVYSGEAYLEESDQKADLFANKLRTYRMRACDSENNCGDWQGGLLCDNPNPTCSTGACTPDEWCAEQEKGNVAFTQCKDFNGNKYCARADNCLPGLEVFTAAKQYVIAPVLRLVTQGEATATGVDIEKSLAVDFDKTYTTNRSGTEYLVGVFASTDPALCGQGTLVGMVDPTTMEPSVYSDSRWDDGRTRIITNLAAGQWYCTRVMPRNGDKVATGSPAGPYTEAAGWSPPSNTKQPSAPPEVVPGSLKLKYGVQDGLTQARAALINGLSDQSLVDQTIQELTFRISDKNNIGGVFNSVSYVGIRVSPHADFDNSEYCYPDGSGGTECTTMQRGFFSAEYDPSTGWSFFEELPTDFGNNRVTLLPAECSGIWVGNDLELTLKWKLHKTEPTYWAFQDQGVQIYMEDLEGNQSDFLVNRFGACDEVFHTSYLPPSPTNYVTPANQSWSNVGKAGEPTSVNFEVEGNLDRDYQYLTNLYDICQPLGICASWDLDTRIGYYNCIDNAASIGDTVQYQITLHDAKDGTGVCDYSSIVAPSSEIWDTTSIEVDGGSGTEYYNASRALTLDTLDEGLYYWCARARDQHVYSPTLDANLSLTKVAPTVVYEFGIDRSDPAIAGFKVYSFDPDGPGEVEITSNSGQWIFTPRVKFVWDPSTYLTGLEAPIKRYVYLIIKGDETTQMDPFDYTGGDPNITAGQISHDGRSQYVLSFYNAPFFGYGQKQFCLGAEDYAGNTSPPVCYDMRIERKEIDGPCITADPHVDQLEVYCNYIGQSGDVEWHDGEENAAKPLFTILDPEMGREAEFLALGEMCCDRRHPETNECVYYLSGSGMQSYSFTLSQSSSAVPDDTPEDDNAGAGPGDTVYEQVCQNTCTDTDQCECNTNGDCGSGSYCNNCKCCRTGQSCVEDIYHFAFVSGHADDINNLYHQIRYSLFYGATQQGGTFYLTIKGWSIAGTETFSRRYRVNVCGCDPDSNDGEPCKDAGAKLRAPRVAMAYFGGGQVPGSGGSSGDSVDVLPFYLDQVEVSNENYASCVEAGVCPTGADENDNAIAMQEFRKAPENRKLPAVNVTWDMAQSYCSWAEKRLPTDLEWDYVMGLGYEMILDPNSETYNNQTEQGRLGPVAINHDPDDLKRDGILNVYTNAAEWAADWWWPESQSTDSNDRTPDACKEICHSSVKDAISDELQYLTETKNKEQLRKLDTFREKELMQCTEACDRKLLRGGTVANSNVDIQYRDALEPGLSKDDLGFRCAKSAKGFIGEAELRVPQVDRGKFVR